MRSTMFLTLLSAFVLAACSSIPTDLRVTPEEAPYTRALGRAHAHNDYEHARPLFDALEHGFNSVEADVYEFAGELYVAHDPSGIRRERTLRSLYLDPLRKHVRANGGKVYRDGTQLVLLIDAKTLAEPTYDALRATLADYRDLLTVFGPGTRVKRSPVLAVISGNRARETMAEGRVRFWETPDEPGAARSVLWRELVEADVDLINTDDLAGLEAFLLEHDR